MAAAVFFFPATSFFFAASNLALASSLTFLSALIFSALIFSALILPTYLVFTVCVLHSVSQVVDEVSRVLVTSTKQGVGLG